MSEESFRLALVAERKRADRSNKGFLLILVDLSGVLVGELGSRWFDEISTALSFSIRETDFCGWQTAGVKFGVVFTELERSIPPELVRLLCGKVLAGLAGVIGNGAARRVQIEAIRHPAPIEGDGDKIDPEIYPDLLKQSRTQRLSRVAKRFLDILGSLTALVLLSPLLFGVAVLVKATSPGPILYRDKRVGRFGRPFRFLKFRSMRVEADPKIHREFVSSFIQGRIEDGNGNGRGEAVFKLSDDERITPIGNFLRRTSLDELPQFWHVLTGEMSLVGPRPPLFYELAKYRSWHRRRVLEAKPGITGLWQVRGRSRTTFDEMVRMDLDYIRRQSLWLDVKILLLTPFAVISGKGAR